MDRNRYAVLLAAAALVASVAVVGLGPFDDAGDPDVEPSPAVVSFVSSGGQCVDAVHAGGPVRVESTEDSLVVAVAGNVSVPDANWVLRDPEVRRAGAGEYVVSFARAEESRKPGRGCTAQAHYEVTVRVPNGSFVLAVAVDGERVRTVRHGEGGSGAGSDATGGDARD